MNCRETGSGVSKPEAEYRETGKTALLEELFTEEQKEYAKKVDYFLGEG